MNEKRREQNSAQDNRKVDANSYLAYGTNDYPILLLDRSEKHTTRIADQHKQVNSPIFAHLNTCN